MREGETASNGAASAGRVRLRRVLDVTAFGVAVMVSAVVLFSPSAGSGLPFPNADKVVHLLIFAAVTWTGLRAGLSSVPLGLAVLAYAIGSEIVQAVLLPRRSGDARDVLADSVGIIVGLLGTAQGRRTLGHLMHGSSRRAGR